jgi:hypothetical protein
VLFWALIMSSYTLPHFGEINPAALEDYYDATIEFQGKEVDLDLNFGNKTIDTARLDIVRKFIDNLADLDRKNKEYIDQDFKNEVCDTVATYIEHHLEDLNENELAEVIDPGNKSIDPKRQLINALHLVRVGFILIRTKGLLFLIIQ